MSISSLFSGVSSASDPLSQLYGVASTTGVTTAPASSDTASDSASALSSSATSASVSDKAKLFSRLQQLSQSDPAEFKKVTADIASQLQAAAQQAGGSQSQALTSLASKFQQASQTGSLSALQPAHHHHGGHRAAASAAYQQAAGQSDPLSGATGTQGTSSATDLQSQVGSIISQVLTQDLGSSTTMSATA